MVGTRTKHLFTVDVEDYFHSEDPDRSGWDRHELRAEASTRDLLEGCAVPDSAAFLDRMWSLTRSRLVVSLPHSVPPRSWLRRAWHGLHSSRLFYYDRHRVDGFVTRLAPGRSEVQTLPGSDRTYVMICDRAGANGR